MVDDWTAEAFTRLSSLDFLWDTLIAYLVPIVLAVATLLVGTLRRWHGSFVALPIMYWAIAANLGLSEFMENQGLGGLFFLVHELLEALLALVILLATLAIAILPRRWGRLPGSLSGLLLGTLVVVTVMLDIVLHLSILVPIYQSAPHS